VILGGGTVIFPTDTVYGVGCDPMQAQAIARIYRLKGREGRKPLSLHLASPEEALEYAGDDPAVAAAIRRLLPGPVTLIVRRPAFIDEQMTSGLPTMGLRVPEHAVCAAILARSGPLAATSANRSGEPAFFGQGSRDRLPAADLLVDAGPTPWRRESTIVDLTAGRPRVVREGVVSVTMLEQVLGRIERPFER
jgi:L-threonylcarbamoyladenylate synthase